VRYIHTQAWPSKVVTTYRMVLVANRVVRYFHEK